MGPLTTQETAQLLSTDGNIPELMLATGSCFPGPLKQQELAFWYSPLSSWWPFGSSLEKLVEAYARPAV